MDVDEVREYRTLIQENSRLKRLLAERDLEIDAIKEVLKKKAVGVAGRKDAAGVMIAQVVKKGREEYGEAVSIVTERLFFAHSGFCCVRATVIGRGWGRGGGRWRDQRPRGRR